MSAAKNQEKDKERPAETEKPPGTGVATAPTSDVPEYLREQVEQDAGKGVSTDRDDNIVPLLYVLQPLSPQCDEASPARVPGARAGMIWLRNYTPRELVSGDEGILYLPCYFYKDWMVWRPRNSGGGLAGIFSERPKEAREVPDPRNPKQMCWRMPNGDEVMETRHHPGFVVIDDHTLIPFAINLTSTGHTVSKNWMFSMMSKKTPTGQPMPSFACLWRLKTRQRSNTQGKWFVLEHHDAGYATLDQYKLGRAMHDAFARGEKVVEQDEGLAATAGEGGEANAAGGGKALDDEIPF
jgi:hypothetical protein